MKKMIGLVLPAVILSLSAMCIGGAPAEGVAYASIVQTQKALDDSFPNAIGWRQVVGTDEVDNATGLVSVKFSLTGNLEDTNSFRTAYYPVSSDEAFSLDMKYVQEETLVRIIRRKMATADSKQPAASVYFVTQRKKEKLADGTVIFLPPTAKTATGFFEYSTPKSFSLPKELTDYTVQLDYYWGIVELDGQPPKVFVDDRIQVVSVGPADGDSEGIVVNALYRDEQEPLLKNVGLRFNRIVSAENIEWYHVDAHKELKPLADKLYLAVKSKEARGGPMVRHEILAGR